MADSNENPALAAGSAEADTRTRKTVRLPGAAPVISDPLAGRDTDTGNLEVLEDTQTRRTVKLKPLAPPGAARPPLSLEKPASGQDTRTRKTLILHPEEAAQVSDNARKTVILPDDAGAPAAPVAPGLQNTATRKTLVLKGLTPAASAGSSPGQNTATRKTLVLKGVAPAASANPSPEQSTATRKTVVLKGSTAAAAPAESPANVPDSAAQSPLQAARKKTDTFFGHIQEFSAAPPVAGADDAAGKTAEAKAVPTPPPVPAPVAAPAPAQEEGADRTVRIQRPVRPAGKLSLPGKQGAVPPPRVPGAAAPAAAVPKVPGAVPPPPGAADPAAAVPKVPGAVPPPPGAAAPVAAVPKVPGAVPPPPGAAAPVAAVPKVTGAVPPPSVKPVPEENAAAPEPETMEEGPSPVCVAMAAITVIVLGLTTLVTTTHYLEFQHNVKISGSIPVLSRLGK